MPSLLQNLRWARLAFGAMWRMAVGTLICRWRKDPVAADPWLIRRIVPAIFRAARADYRRPPALPDLPEAPYILCANHQSHLDVPVMMYSLPLTIRMVAKPSLFEVPILGRYMRTAGHLIARRKAEVISASRTLLDQGYSVGFFPEGTRTPQGTLGPFKAGAFLLSVESRRPILPVAVFGTGEVLPSGSRTPRPGAVGMRVGPMIMPGSDPEKLSAAVRRALCDLLAEGPPPEMAPRALEDTR